jgi:hypothetical protein
MYIYICIQSLNTATSDQSNTLDTTTYFGLVNGPSSGCSQNLLGCYTLGVVNIWERRSRLTSQFVGLIYVISFLYMFVPAI